MIGYFVQNNSKHIDEPSWRASYSVYKMRWCHFWCSKLLRLVRDKQICLRQICLWHVVCVCWQYYFDNVVICLISAYTLHLRCSILTPTVLSPLVPNFPTELTLICSGVWMTHGARVHGLNWHLLTSYDHLEGITMPLDKFGSDPLKTGHA